LVRPDGYFAFATHNRRGTEVMSSLRSVLERQTDRLASPSPREIGNHAKLTKH
jgi:hypothetical protein